MTISINRSSHPEEFLGKGFLKICIKFTGEHPCWRAISIKLQSIFIEIALRHACSPVHLLHIFRTTFLKNTSGRLLPHQAIKVMENRCEDPWNPNMKAHYCWITVESNCNPTTNQNQARFCRWCRFLPIKEKLMIPYKINFDPFITSEPGQQQTTFWIVLGEIYPSKSSAFFFHSVTVITRFLYFFSEKFLLYSHKINQQRYKKKQHLRSFRLIHQNLWHNESVDFETWMSQNLLKLWSILLFDIFD